MKKIVFIATLLTGLTGQSQDLVYTQNFGSPMYLNPAFTGLLAKTSFYLNARQQWPSVSGGYTSTSFSVNHRLDQINSGVGLIIKSDAEGEARYQQLEMSGIYSYLLPVNRDWTVAPAIQASYIRSAFDRETFVFGDQIQDDFSISESSGDPVSFAPNNALDLSAGAVVFNQNMWGGFAVHHLTEPENFGAGTTSLLRKYSLHSGYQFQVQNPGLTEDMILSPSINVNIQGPYTRVGVSTIATYYVFSVGAGVSNFTLTGRGKNILNSFFLLGYSDEHFKVGYSYDFTIANAVGFGGAHEISVGVLLNYDNNSRRKPLKHKKIRKVSCPKF